MQWLNELPFADNRVLQIGFLAACGIAALIVLAIVYRLAFAHRLRVPGGRTRQPRLGLVDAFSLDGQRQLVLVRRDNVEHLVMIGGPNDVLVESQINRAAVPARENSQASPLLVPSTPVRRTEAAAVRGAGGGRSAGEGRRQGPGFAAGASPALRRAGAGRPPPRRAPPAAPNGARARPGVRARPRPIAAPATRAQTDRARAGAPRVRSACRRRKRRSPPDRRRRVRRRQPGRAASRAAASGSVACGNAPADRARQRLAEPRERRSADARGLPREARAIRRPRLPPRLRRRASGEAEEPAARRPSQRESRVARSAGENGAARGANSDERPAGQRGLGPGAACAEDAAVGAGVRRGAKIS